jgi:Asp-tRNA(Asn)/Glu-tRNA(Gln) amidotransferase A subunit family amidase
MDKIGPICRGVEDCAAVLSAIYGPDQRDVTVGDPPFNWTPDVSLSKMRIGYLKAEFDGIENEKQKALYKEALDALKTAGANLEPIELPKFSTGRCIILVAEAAAAFDDITRDGRVNQPQGKRRAIGLIASNSTRFIPQLNTFARSEQEPCHARDG